MSVPLKHGDYSSPDPEFLRQVEAPDTCPTCGQARHETPCPGPPDPELARLQGELAAALTKNADMARRIDVASTAVVRLSHERDLARGLHEEEKRAHQATREKLEDSERRARDLREGANGLQRLLLECWVALGGSEKFETLQRIRRALPNQGEPLERIWG